MKTNSGNPQLPTLKKAESQLPDPERDEGSEENALHNDFFSSSAARRTAAPDESVRGSAIPLWKRILDLSIIGLSVPVWLPLMVLVGLWVKLVSSGPLFFRQERIGHGGRQFTMCKFRSMRVNVATQPHEDHLEQLMHNDKPMTKLDAIGDPRLIPGSGFLRATGLDELPQILNVIRGEMSVVGPRPCTPKEFQNYRTSQKERFRVLPGLTGYWQVNGKNRTTFSKMIALDSYYARKTSVWLDLSIIAQTVPAIVGEVALRRKQARAAKDLESSMQGRRRGKIVN